METLDNINTKLKIEQYCAKVHKHNFKEHLQYFKVRNKKLYKVNKSMVMMLSNLSTTMCHTFLKDQDLLLSKVEISYSLDGSKHDSSI
jgi:hypothetical protein